MWDTNAWYQELEKQFLIYHWPAYAVNRKKDVVQGYKNYVEMMPERVKWYSDVNQDELRLLVEQLLEHLPEVRHITEKKYKVTWNGNSMEVPIVTTG